MTEKQEHYIEAIKDYDLTIRTTIGEPLPRVNLNKLKDLKTHTLKKIMRWYLNIGHTDEYKRFRRIQSENPKEYWKRIVGKSLPEAVEYRSAKKALQDSIRSTMPGEIHATPKKRKGKSGEQVTEEYNKDVAIS